MKLVNYGVKIAPPTESTARAFGSSGELVRFTGGQGTTYRAGDIILKPAEGEDGGAWAAELFSGLGTSDEVRTARPIKSADGSWTHDGYVAWGYLPGQHIMGHYEQKLRASRAYHALLKDVPKPAFLETPASSWATADLVAWQKREFDYPREFMELIDRILPYLKPYDEPEQLVHGDLSGNYLLEGGLSAAIIDFSPVWAPNGFAEGIMLVDAIAWEHAEPAELEIFQTIPNIDQVAWRGALRRIAEQAEHITWFGKDKEQALVSARAFTGAIAYLKATFS